MLEQWEDITSQQEQLQTDHFKKFSTTIEHYLAKE